MTLIQMLVSLSPKRDIVIRRDRSITLTRTHADGEEKGQGRWLESAREELVTWSVLELDRCNVRSSWEKINPGACDTCRAVHLVDVSVGLIAYGYCSLSQLKHHSICGF
jgi:hypothetical protein